MIGKEFDAITKEDIDALVADEVSEGRTIEYKRELPAGTDEGSREFLADVSSFANAGGGDLIYGIREKEDATGKPTGIPHAAEGLSGINADQQIVRLENMLRDGIDPRIPGIRMRHIDGFASGAVIVLRIQRSWASPHMVKFKALSRFFSRTSAGKYQLDVREIRAAFIASESLGEKMSAFRSDRLGKILAGDMPLVSESTPKLVLHLLPVRAFSEPALVDLRDAASDWEHTKLTPMGAPKSYGPPQFNFKGLSYTGFNFASEAIGYIQLFRNGALEAVCARISIEKLLLGVAFEQELRAQASAYLKFLARLDFGAPLFAALSMVSVKSYFVAPVEPHGPHHWSHLNAIEENVLLAPEILIEDEGVDMMRLLRPALDTFWQASGWPGSQGYGESGNWEGYAKARWF